MKIKKFLSVLLTVMLAVGALALPASAEVKDSSKDVTLTIYALETLDGSDVTVDTAVTGEQLTITDKKPVAGVSFNLYRVLDSETSTEVPEGTTAVTTGLTGDDGKVTVVIPAQSQGRYLVVENEKPDYAEGTTIPFLVDLPLTNPEKTGFMYDVYVYPKQKIKSVPEPPSSDTDTEEPKPEPPTSDTDSEEPKPEPPTSDTDSEEPVKPEPPSSDTDSEEPVKPEPEPDTDIPVPKVDKKVSGDDGKTWSNRAAIVPSKGQKPMWKVFAEVPENIAKYTVFEIGDILDNRLNPPKTSQVEVSIDSKALPKDCYTVEIKDQTVSVKFDVSKIASYKNKTIDVIFTTEIRTEMKDSVGKYIENVATLTYTKIADSTITVDTDTDSTDTKTDTTTTTTTVTTSTVDVYTGGLISGFKHDKDNKPLQGAEFALYSDKECKNEIAKATSDKNGYFYFEGLADAVYYLKETKAPNGYQANTNIIEVKVEALITGKPTSVDVLNVPKPNLPVTGGVGIIGLSLIGLSISVLGAVVIYIALIIRRKEKLALA